MRRRRRTTHGGRWAAPRARRGGLGRRYPADVRFVHQGKALMSRAVELAEAARRAGEAMGRFAEAAGRAAVTFRLLREERRTA